MKILYSKMNGFDFQSAMMKLMKAPLPGHIAYKIKLINSELKVAREKIADEYTKNLLDVYAKKDAEGKYDANSFEPAEGKEEEFEKAQEEFGKKEMDFSRPKLEADDIRDIKLTAAEQEALEPVLDDSGFAKAPAPQMPAGFPKLAKG